MISLRRLTLDVHSAYPGSLITPNAEEHHL